MIVWIKKKLGIFSLEARLSKAEGRVELLEKQLANSLEIGVDIHMKTPHMILIWSSLNGGMIKHIETNIKDMRALREMIKEIKNTYGCRNVTFDAPRGMRCIG